MLFTNVFGTVKPLMMKFAIDELEQEVVWQRILYFSLAIVGLALIQGVFRFFQRRILIGASRKAEFKMRNDFIAHLQNLSNSYYDKNTTGDIMARATSDVDAVRMAFGPGVMYSVDTLISAIFALVMMFSLSWKLTLTALIIFPLVSITVNILGKLTFKQHTKVQESYSNLNTFTQENLSGVRVVKSFALENQHVDRFSLLSLDYLKHNMSLVKIQALFTPLLFFLLGIGIILILLIGGRSIMLGELTLGSFAAFMAYLMMLAWPMIAIGWVVNIFQRGEASMKRIDSILNTEPEIKDDAEAIEIESLVPKIEFSNLTFSYGDRGKVLDNINLTIAPGTTFGIIGGLGSGKSTLVKLLPRLYDPPENTVFIDGIAVEKLTLLSLRQNIAFVPQDSFLFSEKIRENIAFDDDTVTDALAEAAASAQLLSDVEGFPEKFDTMVGERGITLSGGQKQRVTLARALLKDAPILILDDCLSAVDASTEAQILERLRNVFLGKTVIVVSHRIFAVSGLDNIVVMEDGGIIERGTHDELLELKGYYHRLYKKQLLERELEEL